MTKLHFVKQSLLTIILVTCINTGLGHFYAAHAQSNDRNQTPPRLSFGGDVIPGMASQSSYDPVGNYFSGRTSYAIPLGTDPNEPERTDQFWLAFDGINHDQQGISAQIGLGYAPTSTLGFAVGPFFDLNSPTTNKTGLYQIGGVASERPLRRTFLPNNGTVLHDAGLAASLSYMPLEDIWIGLHGSVSHSIAPSPPNQGILDGIDAMLGLTASYRIEF